MTVDEVYTQWLEYKKLRVKESTISIYRERYKKHIAPIFGNDDIENLGKKRVKPAIDKYIREMSRHGARDNLVLIKNIMKFADEELELRVPSYGWRYDYPTASKDGQRKLDRYTADEIKKLSAFLKDTPSPRNLAMLIAIGTGLRIGEICGLRWEDVNFTDKTISVNRTIERIMTEDGHTRLLIGSPKSKSSIRTVPIPQGIVQMCKNFSKVARRDYYVATGTARPTEPRTFRNYYKETVSRCLGKDYVLKFHALRHTFASIMIENKVDVKTVSILLGHSDVGVTLNVYTHPTEETKNKAVRMGLKGII